MLKKRIFLLALSLISIAASVHADPLPPDAYLTRCRITPGVKNSDDDYPGASHIIASNKLIIPAGKSQLAEGQFLYLTGRVLDENCLPIPDAVVEIWQANDRGVYTYATNAQRANPYPVFAGAGRAVTDNLGRFDFVTIFPGPYNNRAPHIHFRVAHKDFNNLFTEMFFEQDRRNDNDRELKAVKSDLRDRLMAGVGQRSDGSGLNAYFDITLKGSVPYKKF